MKNPQVISNSAIEQLSGCSARAAGLLYLLAGALVKADSGPLNPPSTIESEGILWLSTSTASALDDAVRAIIDAPIATVQPTPETES